MECHRQKPGGTRQDWFDRVWLFEALLTIPT